MPRLMGVRERKHLEHCFVFSIPGSFTPPFVIRQQYLIGKFSWVVVGVQTGNTLPSSDSEFRLLHNSDVKARVTFDTFAAFFPRTAGVPAPYHLVKPIAFPEFSFVQAEIQLNVPLLIPQITITCVGVSVTDIDFDKKDEPRNEPRMGEEVRNPLLAKSVWNYEDVEVALDWELEQGASEEIVALRSQAPEAVRKILSKR